MFLQIFIGILIIGSNAFIHAYFLSVAIRNARHLIRWVEKRPTIFHMAMAFSSTVVWVMLAHLIETGVWATLFRVLNIFEDIETAFYFALVAYTTLGFGDITLPEQWQLLSGFVASSGFLMFGWSVAFQVSYITEFSAVKNVFNGNSRR